MTDKLEMRAALTETSKLTRLSFGGLALPAHVLDSIEPILILLLFGQREPALAYVKRLSDTLFGDAVSCVKG